MKTKDKIMISRSSVSGEKVTIFRGGNHVSPWKDIELMSSFVFCRSFEFNKTLDDRTSEGALDYFVTPSQYNKWYAGIHRHIEKEITYPF